MESIWNREKKLKKFDSLKENIYADTIVIGGGMCGVLTAYLLGKSGREVILLEKDRIFSGQSCRTTAKITAQHGCVYYNFINDLGKEKAAQYAKANIDAVNKYSEIINELKIECGFRRCDSYIYSLHEKERMEKEAEACVSLGMDAEFTQRTELPFDVDGAVKLKSQACFDPIEFISGILENMPENVKIYEKSNVISVEKGIIHVVVSSENAEEVKDNDKFTASAENIIFCTNFPFINSHGMYFARMHRERSYVLALKKAKKLENMYLCISPKENDNDIHDTLSFRSCELNGEDILLLGGGKHRTGYNKNGGVYDSLKSIASELYSDSKVIGEWSAQDCITLDSIPYIGRYSQNAPEGWYCATGFMKWGMSSSMVAAEIITGLINDKKYRYPVFDTSRFSMQDIPTLLKEGKEAVKGIAKENFTVPQETVEKIPVGQGMTVTLNGENIGLYRESGDEYYAVDTKCPHLGCRLEWNPDDLSWDCPCHGSRFDYTGKLLDNPAQTDIGTKSKVEIKSKAEV